MTNALAVLNGGALAKLSEADLIFRDEGQNYDDAFTFIPSQFTVAPGGAKSFVDANGEMLSVPLTGIVLDSVKTRGYWPNPTNKIPFCSSIGNVYGVVNMTFTDEDFRHATTARVPHPAILLYDKQEPIPDRFPCATCAMNQWGSRHHQGKNKSGKACDEKRRLLVLFDGWAAPVILTVSTMSAKPWDIYCSGLVSRFKLSFYAVKTTFKIEKAENADGKPYGVVSFEMGERVTDPILARAIVETQKQFRDLLRAMGVEADYESTPAEDGSFVASGETVNADSAESIPF